MRAALAALLAVAVPSAVHGEEDAPLAAAQPAIAVSGTATQGGFLRGTVPAGTVALRLDGAPVPLAPDGSFFIAFDRDAPAAATLEAERADGLRLALPLTVTPRAWPIEQVAVARRPTGVPDAEFARRRAGELALIVAARALDGGAAEGGAQGWRQAMVRPAAGRVSGRFGAQRIYRGEPGAYHTGMDIAAGAGAAFVAPAAGVVVLAAAESPFSLEGRLLILDHGMGLSSAFLHAESLAVRVGDRVRQGQVLGRVGMSGRATGPHLHWGLVWRGRRLDPLLFAP